MTTASEQIKTLAQFIGHWGDCNKFNEWYWQTLHGYSYNPCTAWCAVFQSYGSMLTGLPCNYSASAAAYATQFPRVDDSDVMPGDIVIFNWDGRTDTYWADHVGIVEWSDINGSGYFGTVEGNTGNSDVARVTRNNNASYFTAFYRPPYDDESSIPTENNPKGDKVQSVYNGGGKWHVLYKDGAGAASHRYARTQATIDKLKKEGYQDQGIAWEAKRGSVKAVYKMKDKRTGDTLFTVDLPEAKQAEKGGYTYSGVPFFANDVGTPVYRLFSKWGEHYFTTDKAEANSLKKSKDWTYEGVAFCL